MTVALSYKRGNANFSQSFNLTQNGAEFDVSAVSGVLSITWWFLENKPGATKKSISYFSYGIPVGGTKNSQVTFVVPTGFFTTATDYNCDIEVYNNNNLVFHSNPSFIVNIAEVAGLHTDP